MVTNFFLGANSSAGFRSLYENFTAPEGNFDILVLKGGPGVGKSSFMKYIGSRAEEAGEDVEYIWCSGDPDSLDAVRLPRVGVIAVDGTSPHVVEPQYPAAVDRYVNLGQFYHIETCKQRREEIAACTADYKAAYARAYRALQAAGEVADTLRETLTAGYDRAKLERRTAGIIDRELGRRGCGGGTVSRRYLGGPTHRGLVWRFDTVDTLAGRVYELLDSGGIGHQLMAAVEKAAAERGYDTIACLDPDRPECIQHLILPELGLAFVTSAPGMEYPGKPYRRLHLDALLDQRQWKQNKARCRFYRRMHGPLLEEGIQGLQAAKAAHDRLEAVYNDAVDFGGVYALAEREWGRIAGWL